MFSYNPEIGDSDNEEVRGVSETMFVPEEVDKKLHQAASKRLKDSDKGRCWFLSCFAM